MISVELRSFIKPDKYKELIEKYNNILHTEKQINYFLNSKEDIRFMKTKRYSEICIKHGNMHDDIKKEKSVKIDSKYKLAYAAAKRAKIIEQEEYTSYEDGMCVKPVGQALEEILVDQTKMTFK